MASTLFFCVNLQAQTNTTTIKDALLIAAHNKSKLENSEQLLVVYNYQPESYSAFFVALEKKDNRWIVKQEPVQVCIGKNGFATQLNKREGDGKSPTGIFRLGKLYTYEKQLNTLLENQQTTAEDKWIDDSNSEDYNRFVKGATNAKSYENLLLKTDAYKYCMVIEYNTNPIIKGKGSAIFFHLAVKKSSFTAGCVAIDEENMKLMVSWLDPKRNPTIIMGNFNVLKSGL
ncbi:L,D-transpeptidase family protein [Flavobacterium sp. GB2R13]|uniref:L,D-transpeptidase family protein n=1 Tax=Flavobacterium algoris TaxID=3398733 RepID=UPI003A8A54A6